MIDRLHVMVPPTPCGAVTALTTLSLWFARHSRKPGVPAPPPAGARRAGLSIADLHAQQLFRPVVDMTRAGPQQRVHRIRRGLAGPNQRIGRPL